MKAFPLFLFFVADSFASLSVYNDSPFPLVVKVLGANGARIGEKEVPARIQSYIEDQIGTSDPVGQGENPGDFKNYDRSLTPYQVYWYCLNGTLYSACLDVAAGATVTAGSCAGSYFCPECK